MMPGAVRNGLQPGNILRDPCFYLDIDTGEFKPKLLVVLAVTRGNDVVWRLLTSRQHGRPEQPPCYHGDPYPGFYLGVIDTSAGLGGKSWLDLRPMDDGDGVEVRKKLAAGTLTVVTTLPSALLRAALQCAASANDTTQAQERAIRDQLAALQ